MPDSLNIHNHVAPLASDSVIHRPKVVEHMVMEAPDSVLGAYFVGQPAPLVVHRHEVVLEHTTIPLPKDTAFLHTFEQLWNPAIREMIHQHEEIPWTPNGIAGDPVDYQFRNDDYVTSLILLSFFIMAWVIASSWKFLRGQFKDFFYIRERPNLFSEREDTILRGRLFLILQTCFLIALVFFTVSRTYLPDVFAQVSPYMLLGSSAAVSMVYYLGKLSIYNIVNHTFFSPAKCKMWNDAYLTSVLVTGLALLPVTLMAVFLETPYTYTVLGCILLLSVIKSLLLYKCYRIFFNTLLGGVHIILYLCALEIIPLGILIVSLVVVSSRLVTL